MKIIGAIRLDERISEKGKMSKEMNERFTSDEKGNILDDGEILTVEEILKYINWYRRDMLKLSIENDELRQQQQRLFNYFKDYLKDEMDSDNFSEMWDNVKEDGKWNNE